VSSDLAITMSADGDVTLLHLHGRLDLPGTAALLGAVRRAALDGSRAVVCDLEGLRDTPPHHLLTVFPAAQRHLGLWPDRELHVAAASPSTTGRLIQLRTHRYVTLQPTLDDALAAVRAGRAASRHQVHLTAEATSPRQARRSLDAFLAPRRPPWADVAQVVVSELTGNVVRHVRRPFTLQLTLDARALLVSVTDRSRQEPVLQPHRSDADHGRGIQLVEALSQAWGVRLVHEAGKTVWARIGTVPA